MPLNDATKDIVAGTMGGVAQVLVGQYVQLRRSSHSQTLRYRQSARPNRRKRHLQRYVESLLYLAGLIQLGMEHSSLTPGVLDCISHILRDEGPMAFYKGTTMPLIGVGACVSIQFGVVQWSKRVFNSMNAAHQPERKSLTPLQLYMSGLFGGVANSFLAGPIEHVRIRLQTQKGHALHGPFDCLKQYVVTKPFYMYFLRYNRMMQHSGIAGVYRGLGPTIVREGHGMGVYFLTYEYIVQKRLEVLGIARDKIPASTSLLAGGLSGLLLWLMIYPIDVVKSYMQTDAIQSQQRRFRTSFDVVRHIQATYGLNGFVRGIVPTLIRVRCMTVVNCSTNLYRLHLRMPQRLPPSKVRGCML